MDNNKKPVYPGSVFKKIKIEVEAEVTEKGVIFILLPKSRFQLHRDNIQRYMFLDKGPENE